MPLYIIREDIIRPGAEAVVAPLGAAGVPEGGAGGRISAAAGPQLRQAVEAAGRCSPGNVIMTPGYELCRHIIHARGPVWCNGTSGEESVLHACYTNALKLAVKSGISSIAFPLISAGANGYPHALALGVATQAISSFLIENDTDITVYLALFGVKAYDAGRSIFPDIAQYIDDNYVEAHTDRNFENRRFEAARRAEPMPAYTAPEVQMDACGLWDDFGDGYSLDDMLGMIDESFSQMVMRLIEEKGLKPAECYKRANIDKKHFSKIKGDIHYKPKKSTALALAVALKLDIESTRELLMKAGYAFSHSDKFDIIVEYFILKGKYDIFEINEALYLYDQPLLGNI